MATSKPDLPLSVLLLRTTVGGILMGLANLVPGISGGTMLLAAGIYERFIGAIADLTTLKLKPRSILVVGVVALTAGLAILLLAGVLRDLVVDHRFVMYSLFIGLTLGGLPAVWRLTRPADGKTWAGAVVGLLVMVALAWAKSSGIVGGGDSNFLTLFLAGVAGASAMILPGVSGGYLLLLLGQYLPILSGIEDFKNALSARDLGALMDPALGVVLPVGLGVVTGIVLVANLLRFLLAQHRKATLGVLIGLLLGSVIGLWPFQETYAPNAGETIIKGQLVTSETVDTVDPEDWPTRFFSPSPGQIGLSVALVLVGLGLTAGLARIGQEESEPVEPASVAPGA